MTKRKYTQKPKSKTVTFDKHTLVKKYMLSHTETRSLAVAKRPCNCDCGVGQFWSNI